VSGLLCVLTRSPRTKAGILAVPFFFQAGPIENFAYDTAVDFSDYDTLSRQRFSRPVSRALTTYTLDTLFTNYLMADVPAQLQVYTQGLLALGVEPGVLLDPIENGANVPARLRGRKHPFFSLPEERVRQLREVQDSLTPCILTMADSSVLRTPPRGQTGRVGVGGNELSVEVTLRSVKQEERAGETDALYVSCTFVEFHTVSLRTVKRGTAKGAEGAVGKNDLAKLTILRLDAPRCTIARLAKHYYGDASKVKPIYARNGSWLKSSQVGRNENLRALAAGDVRQTVHTKALKKLFKSHQQIIIPRLKPAAASTKPPTKPTIGSR
jgi:hypothetical protein